MVFPDVQVLLEAMKPKLPAFSPLHLAKVAQGIASLRYRFGPCPPLRGKSSV